MGWIAIDRYLLKSKSMYSYVCTIDCLGISDDRSGKERKDKLLSIR